MKYARAVLRYVQPYVPGEQPKSSSVIKLNTNENPYPPSPKVLDALADINGNALRKYPDPVATEFREICAMRYGYPGADWVMAGNGMDELLALAIRTFVDPGDTIVSVYPTYSLYETLAKLHGAGYATVDLDDHYEAPEALFEARGSLLFFPRPNAPSGVCVSRETMEQICKTFPGLVVIDEAYVDFADDSCMDFPKNHDNVMVMRTFSKSFGLAGLRIGTVTGAPDLIQEFLKTKDSYNMNVASQTAGAAAMDDYDYMRANVDKVRETRRRMTESLRELGFSVPESQANFVLAVWPSKPSARDIFQHLRDRNILVRYFDAPGLRDALRISVGTDSETDTLLQALGEIIGS